MAQIVGFTGSRHGFIVPWLVKAVALSVSHAGHSVAVGCASGVDAMVRRFVPLAQVFKVASPGAGSPVSFAAALARRSQAMVSACSVLVGFASVGCPAGVSPAKHFSGGGSGTWASLAFAVSQGVRVFVFPAAGVPMPSWPGGQWVQGAPSGLWLWIIGDSKQYKDKLKALGCWWHPKRECWYFKPQQIKSKRSKGSLEDLAKKYGIENVHQFKKYEDRKPLKNNLVKV